jgi:hypothetical protein
VAVSKANLRAVGPGEKPDPPRVLTLIEAVEAGDYLGILRAQRREIAVSLPGEKGPAKAALHRQLTLVAKEIETLEARDTDEAGGTHADVDDGKFDAAAI